MAQSRLAVAIASCSVRRSLAVNCCLCGSLCLAAVSPFEKAAMKNLVLASQSCDALALGAGTQVVAAANNDEQSQFVVATSRGQVAVFCQQSKVQVELCKLSWWCQ
jgi:hypothetical protein